MVPEMLAAAAKDDAKSQHSWKDPSLPFKRPSRNARTRNVPSKRVRAKRPKPKTKTAKPPSMRTRPRLGSLSIGTTAAESSIIQADLPSNITTQQSSVLRITSVQCRLMAEPHANPRFPQATPLGGTSEAQTPKHHNTHTNVSDGSAYDTKLSDITTGILEPPAEPSPTPVTDDAVGDVAYDVEESDTNSLFDLSESGSDSSVVSDESQSLPESPKRKLPDLSLSDERDQDDKPKKVDGPIITTSGVVATPPLKKCKRDPNRGKTTKAKGRKRSFGDPKSYYQKLLHEVAVPEEKDEKEFNPAKAGHVRPTAKEKREKALKKGDEYGRPRMGYLGQDSAPT